MKFKLLILLFATLLFANTVTAQPFQADAQTRRIPAGTKLKLQLLDPVNTVARYEGDAFSAMLLQDQKSGNSVILPAGSIVRCSISKIKPVRMLSRGAVLYIDFDHVVTPNGRQLPLTLAICDRKDLTDDGGIYGSKGYGDALKRNWAKTVDITKNATQWGIDTGSNLFEGGQYLITPFSATAGAFGGSAYLVGNSFIDLFRKGQDVILNQGSIIDVVLTNPIDVPMN